MKFICLSIECTKKSVVVNFETEQSLNDYENWRLVDESSVNGMYLKIGLSFTWSSFWEYNLFDAPSKTKLDDAILNPFFSRKIIK